MLVDNFKLEGQGAEQARSVADAVRKEVMQDRSSKGVDYHKNWDMYSGRHANYFKKRLDEDADVYDYRIKNGVVVNLIKFTVDLAAKYLYGRASKVIRKYSENDATHKRMLELVKRVGIDSLMLQAASRAAIFGEQPIRNVAVDWQTGLQVKGKSTPTTYPHPILLDPGRTYVKRNRWNKIVAVVTEYNVQDFTTGKLKSVTELVVDDTRWTWESEAVTGHGSNVIQVTPQTTDSTRPGIEIEPRREKNLYKLADEFVLFVNNEDRVSDIEDILDLNISLDESFTDKQHFFNKHGWPQLLTEVNLDAVQHSPNKIWEIMADMDDGKKVSDRLAYLTWDGKMTDHKEFTEALVKNIFILSNTAAISTGDLAAIGQLRSGAALITAHSVAIHKTEAKQIMWEKNERELFYAMARMDSYLQNTKFESRYAEFDPVIKFPRDFVPGAEHERTQIQQIQVNSHLVSLRDVIAENNPHLATNDAIEAKYKLILEEAGEVVDSLRKFETAKAPNQGTTGKSGTSSQKSKEQK